MPTLLKRGLFNAILLAAIGLASASCAPLELPSAQGGDASASAQEVATSGYPGPGGTPTIAVPTPILESKIATPRPDELVVVGEITEVTGFKSEPQLPYTLEEVKPTAGNPSILPGIAYVDRATGEKVKLGDDYGSALFVAQSERYIAWSYHCETCKEAYGFKSGLYVHDITSHKDMYLSDGQQARIYSDWILYRVLHSLAEDKRTMTIGLIAHNAQTGERIELSKSIEVAPGRNPLSYYNINEDVVAWIEKDKGDQKVKIQALDLQSRNQKTLNVETDEPLDIAVSSTLVVWRDRFWKGYDLIQDELFTPPWAPSGMENAKGSFYLTAEGDTLQWTFVGEDGNLRYFKAPIIRKKR